MKILFSKECGTTKDTACFLNICECSDCTDNGCYQCCDEGGCWDHSCPRHGD